MGFSGMPAGRSLQQPCKAELWSSQPGRIIPALIGPGSQGCPREVRGLVLELQVGFALPGSSPASCKWCHGYGTWEGRCALLSEPVAWERVPIAHAAVKRSARGGVTSPRGVAPPRVSLMEGFWDHQAPGTTWEPPEGERP